LDFGLYRGRETMKKVSGLLERRMISNLSQDSTINKQDLFHGRI
jgi:hypothetical protein